MYLAKDEKLPLALSLSFGLQHMLAMCVGIATSGGMLHANEVRSHRRCPLCTPRGFATLMPPA